MVFLSIGKIYKTPGVEALGEDVFRAAIARHIQCNWSEMDPQDQSANAEAIRHGGRVFSSHTLKGEKVWVITEADRASTTVLLPIEY